MEIVGIVHGRAGGKGWQNISFVDIRQKPTGLRRWIRLPDLNQPNLIAELFFLEPNIIVSCFYPDKIPQSILSLGMGFNVHPSDLPKWRGPEPYRSHDSRRGDGDDDLRLRTGRRGRYWCCIRPKACSDPQRNRWPVVCRKYWSLQVRLF